MKLFAFSLSAHTLIVFAEQKTWLHIDFEMHKGMHIISCIHTSTHIKIEILA